MDAAGVAAASRLDLVLTDLLALLVGAFFAALVVVVALRLPELDGAPALARAANTTLASASASAHTVAAACSRASTLGRVCSL